LVYPNHWKERAALNGVKCHSDCYGCKHKIIEDDFVLHNLFETMIAHEKSNKAVYVKDMKARLKENWKIIAKYAKDPLSRDAAELESINFLMMQRLASDVNSLTDHEFIHKFKNGSGNA
jgi:hypothetical protein